MLYIVTGYKWTWWTDFMTLFGIDVLKGKEIGATTQIATVDRIIANNLGFDCYTIRCYDTYTGELLQEIERR